MKTTIILSILLMSMSASAINYQQTQRSNSLTFEKLEDSRVQKSHVRNDYRWILTAGGSYVDDPLVVKDFNNTNQLETVLGNMYAVHLGFGYYFKPWFMLGASTEYNWFQDNNNAGYNGFSDPQIRAKFRVINEERWAVSIIPFVNLGLDQGKVTLSNLQSNPALNGIEVSPISDLGTGFGLKLAWEYVFDKFQVAVNLGYRKNDSAIEKDTLGITQVDYRESFLTGIGIYVPFSRSWGVNVEYLRRAASELFNNDQAQNELFMGVGAGITKRLNFFAGVGVGNLLEDDDGNDYRVAAGIKYTGGYYDAKKAILVPKKINVNCRKRFVFGDTNRVIVRFPNDVSGMDSNESLDRVGQILIDRAEDIELVTIEGHTSALAKDSYNMKLSQDRANNIKEYLTRLGVPVEKMDAVGFGETRHIDNSDTGLLKDKNSRAARTNRRVEFSVDVDPKFDRCFEAEIE